MWERKLGDEEKLLADLWMRQTDIFLKTLTLMPAIELGILAGWYVLVNDHRHYVLINEHRYSTAILAAIFGALIMLLAFTYLYRAQVYIGHFHDRVPVLAKVQETI